ncbi:EAL domain-containing protein [Dechloromonas sp.]|uniref:EAL domain-containing protein n=1 Tax=Dechloromonas sp. TaxID=1917218 RepID=UPI0011FC0D31|nr:EAL domain-containing protein [Dechloromonas sp.]MBU3697343.1 EAL domain-containing protein [Dechloromonas sp.]TEX49069.1 MAG: hypothetical protein CFR70_03965 [Rhodocyclaceae bacterium]
MLEERRPTKSLSVLIMGAFSVLFLALLVIVAASILTQKAEIEKRHTALTESLARIAVTNLEHRLKETSQFLEAMAARDSVRALNPKTCDPAFRDYQKSHPNFTALTTFSVSGAVICSPFTGGVTLSEDLLRPKQAGSDAGFRVGEIQRGPFTQRWVLPLSHPIYDAEGQPKGYIVAWFDLQKLEPIGQVSLGSLPKTTLVTVFDDQRRVLSRSIDGERWIGADRQGKPQAEKAVSLRQGSFQLVAQTDGIERLFSVMPVPGTNWVVSVGVPTEAMAAELNAVMRFGAGILLLMAGFGFMLMMLVRHHFLRPVITLLETAKRLQSGALEQRVPIAQMGVSSEMNTVAGQINTMLDIFQDSRRLLELREKELRTLFREMGSGFALHELIFDQEGQVADYRFLAVNPAFERIIGLSEAQIIGRTVLEVLPNLDRKWIVRYANVVQTGQPEIFEDFSPELQKHFEVRCFTPQPGRFATLVTDVTERHVSNRVLEREKRLLRRVIDTIPDWLYFKDVSGHYLAANQAFLSRVGLSDAELIGKTDRVLFKGAFAEGLLLQHERTLREGGALKDECWTTLPGGDKVLLQILSTPMLDDKGNVLGVLSLSRDITAQFAIKEKLHEREQTLEAMLENSLDGFWIVNAEGRVVDVNAAYVRQSGYTREELLGRPASDFDLGILEQGFAPWLAEVARNGADLRLTRHRRKSGAEWQTEVNASYWPEQNSVFVFIRDVYQRRRSDALSAMRQNLSRYMGSNDLSGLMQSMLDTAEKVTGSSIGFFHFVDHDQENLTLQAWSTNTLENMCTAEGKGQHYAVSQAGVWVDCIKARQPVIHNDYASLAHKRGLPEGHAPVIRELTVPVIHDGRVVAIIGVGNKPEDYDDQDLQMVSDFAGIAMDLVEAKRADDELRQAAAVFENTQDAMMVTDADEKIVRINRAFTEQTGYSAEEAIGQTPALLRSETSSEAVFKSMYDGLREQGRWRGELINRRKNGEAFPVWLTISSIRDARGMVANYVATFTDISSIKKAEERIHALAFFDSLTQLPNRRLFVDRLQRAISAAARRQSSGAVMLIDLDNFKILNDAEGHEVGDLLLIEVAQRIQGCVRSQDSVARLGGDEFIVLLDDLGADPHQAASRAESVAEKILASLNDTYRLGHIEHHSQASIGVTLFSTQDVNVEELIKHADSAMYSAKNAGRNTIRFFDPSMQAALESRLAMEAELYAALSGEQLKLFYQPQVDELGHTVGAEVLLRWFHPTRGMVSPAQFIPLAESTGQIIGIGRWVIESACRQLKRWEADAVLGRIQLAVNVSARQFRQADFVQTVRTLVDQAGIEPGRLKLELTESIVVDNVADTIEKMHRIRDIGISFSMDDFGTGYSSLSYLKRLPLSQLKIDQSFVRDIASDPNDAAIVEAIIKMGTSLGMHVIAEGVETTVQRKFLAQHGCMAYQGYLFSKPVAIDEFERFARGSDRPATPN